MFTVLDKKLIKIPIIVLIGMLAGLILNIYLDPTPLPSGTEGSSFINREFILALILSAVIFVGLAATPFPQEIHAPILALWMIRCIFIVGSMVFFDTGFGLDKIFTLSQNSLANQGSIGPNIVSLGPLTWFVSQVSLYISILNSYVLLSLIWACLGLIGILLIYFSFSQFLTSEKPALLWILGLFPSIFIWSMTLSQSPIILLGLGLFFYGSMAILDKRSLKNLITIAFGLILLFTVNFWTPLCLLPSFILAWLQSSRLPRRIRIGISATIIFVTGSIASLVLNTVQNLKFVDIAQEALSHYSRWEPFSNHSIMEKMAENLFLFLPLGMATALLRPVLGEWSHPFGIIVGIENLILTLGGIWSLSKFKYEFVRQPTMIFLVSVIFFTTAFAALVCFSNVTMILQNRVLIVPFFIILLCFHFEKNRRFVAAARINSTD